MRCPLGVLTNCAVGVFVVSKNSGKRKCFLALCPQGCENLCVNFSDGYVCLCIVHSFFFMIEMCEYVFVCLRLQSACQLSNAQRESLSV